jgi:hypothetical protein
MRDMVDNARKIVLTVQIPVFADADTGYGDAINTYYTVREYIQAGIAGAHIEDQTFPPKAGPRRPSGSRKRASRADSSSRKGEAGHSRDNIPMRPLLSRRQLHRQER